MTSMLIPGDEANWVGSPITGVSGPSGCVRSTILSRPVSSASISSASSAGMALLLSLELSQVALELAAVLEEPQIGDEACGARRLDLRDDGGQVMGGERRIERVGEFRERTHRRAAGDACRGRDSCQVAPRRRRGREAAHGEEALVVEHHMEEVLRAVAGEGRETTQVHENRAVAVEHDDLQLGAAQRQAEAER